MSHNSSNLTQYSAAFDSISIDFISRFLLPHSGICVSMLHPGFNKTDMTKKYEAIWEIEGE